MSAESQVASMFVNIVDESEMANELNPLLEAFKSSDIKKVSEMLGNMTAVHPLTASMEDMDLLKKLWSGSNRKDSLTPREEAIMTEMVEGGHNKEIGVKLGISVSTVNSHISVIFRKLEVHNRHEAVAKYSSMKNPALVAGSSIDGENTPKL